MQEPFKEFNNNNNDDNNNDNDNDNYYDDSLFTKKQFKANLLQHLRKGNLFRLTNKLPKLDFQIKKTQPDIYTQWLNENIEDNEYILNNEQKNIDIRLYEQNQKSYQKQKNINKSLLPKIQKLNQLKKNVINFYQQKKNLIQGKENQKGQQNIIKQQKKFNKSQIIPQNFNSFFFDSDKQNLHRKISLNRQKNKTNKVKSGWCFNKTGTFTKYKQHKQDCYDEKLSKTQLTTQITTLKNSPSSSFYVINQYDKKDRQFVNFNNTLKQKLSLFNQKQILTNQNNDKFIFDKQKKRCCNKIDDKMKMNPKQQILQNQLKKVIEKGKITSNCFNEVSQYFKKFHCESKQYLNKQIQYQQQQTRYFHCKSLQRKSLNYNNKMESHIKQMLLTENGDSSQGQSFLPQFLMRKLSNSHESSKQIKKIHKKSNKIKS